MLCIPHYIITDKGLLVLSVNLSVSLSSKFWADYDNEGSKHFQRFFITRAGTINRYIDYRNRFLKISDYRFKVFQIDNRK